MQGAAGGEPGQCCLSQDPRAGLGLPLLAGAAGRGAGAQSIPRDVMKPFLPGLWSHFQASSQARAVNNKVWLMIPARFALRCCQLWAFPWHPLSSALHSHPQLPGHSCHTLGVKESLLRGASPGLKCRESCWIQALQAGNVLVSFCCGFFIISALGRVREKVRGEMSWICISLCLRSLAWDIWQILWPCLGFFAAKHPQPYRKIQLVVSKLSPDRKFPHYQKSKLGMFSITLLFFSHHLGKCKTPLLLCEIILWQLGTAAEPKAL